MQEKSKDYKWIINKWFYFSSKNR